MAEFSTPVGGAPSGGMSPQQPVQDRSSLIALDAIGNIGSKIASVGAQFVQNQRALDQQAALNNAVSSFSQQQLKLADAVEQGAMSSQEARMRMRKNYTEAISNNPGLTGILADTQKSLLSTAGLGSVVAEGTEQEKINIAIQKEASIAGWISPSASPTEQQQGIAAYSKFKRHQADIDAQQNALALESAQVGLQSSKIGLQRQSIGLATDRIQQVTAGYSQQSARLNLIQDQQQQNSRLAVGGIADSYNYKFSKDLDEITGKLQRNEISKEDAIKLADSQYAMINQTVNSIGRDAGGDYVNNIVSPMRMRYENTMKFLNGDMDAKLLEQENTRTIALQTKNALGDPQVAKVVATSRLLGNANLALIPGVNQAVMSILDKNTDPNTKPADIIPDSDDERKNVGNYLGVLKSSISNYNAGTYGGDKETTQHQLTANMTNVLKSIDVHSVAVNNPAEYNQVVDLISSPEYGKFAKEGGGIYADAAQNASTILQTQYVDQVLPLLRKEYEQTSVGAVGSPTMARGLTPSAGAREGSATSKVIEPVFSGSGVVFRAVNGANDTLTRNKVKDLNAKVGSVMNKLIRMDAHLSGNTDYKASYDRLYESIFGVQKDGSEQ